MYVEQLTEVLESAKYGNRSYTRNVLKLSKEREQVRDIAEASLEVVAFSIANNIPLTATCRKVATRIFRILEIEESQDDTVVIKTGADFIDMMAQCDLVKAERFNVIDDDGKVQYFLMPTDEGFVEYIIEHSAGSLRANNGITPWTGPTLHVGEHRLDIVKSARRHGLLSNYRYSEMPDYYLTLNRLNETPWVVNKALLEAVQGSPVASKLLPVVISAEDRKDALAALNKADRTALWLSEIRFKQLVEKEFDEEAAEAISKKSADEWKMEKQFEHLEVISAWSKRMDFERCVRLANEYGEDELHFIYNADSRGRIYALQHGLNPQGDDFAKAMLHFAAPKPVSIWDLYVCIANHAGQDKASYDERVQWVQDNADNIYTVGADLWSAEAQAWLEESGVMSEKKSKWQFVAAAMEFSRLHDHLREGHSEDTFLCRVPVGYDATNSGLQILSAIGRDEVIAPLVNITDTPKPGDVYQYVGDAVAEIHEIEALKGFKAGEKIWRKICKRNVMTKSYAATRVGMGDQQWEDRKDHGCPITADLSVSECRQLGATVYDACETKLLRAAALMGCMRDAMSDINGSIVQWKMPNGFTAFQVKDKSKKEQVKVRIGDVKRIDLVFYTFTDTPHIQKHKFAIAPDMVHSIDAWLLTMIVNDLPKDANLAFIHDQFSSDSSHGEDIQSAARGAYELASSRTVFQALISQASGDDVELPEAGEWDPKELRNASYLVC